jgi:hypothetical protein
MVKGDAAAMSHSVNTPGEWLVGPRREADFIDSSATEASLRARLGPAAVRADSVYVGEGESELGTVVFPDDSARVIAVLWRDSLARSHPRSILVSATRSTWRVYPGVGIGTDLRTLEALNGRAFHLSGFAWDYSGTITAFDGGHLDTLWGGSPDVAPTVMLRLSPAPGAPDSLFSQVIGDREFSSQHPAMVALNPRVYQILLRPR